MDMRIMNMSTKKEEDAKSELRGITLIFNVIFVNQYSEIYKLYEFFYLTRK